MNRRIRIITIVLVGCFVLLFLQLNNLQILEANSLTHSVYVPSSAPHWYSDPRGEIVSAEGDVLAYSTRTPGGYVRRYPYGSLFADVTGYFDAKQESAPYGIEAEYNSFLVAHTTNPTNLNGLLTQNDGTDDVQLTVSLRLQMAAKRALGNFQGAIMAFDPQNGDVLAMYSNPTYDPNRLSTLNTAGVQSYYNAITRKRPSLSWGGALLNDATDYPLAPGSTFKVITTSTIFDHERSLLTYIAPNTSGISISGTDLIFHNYGGETCGGPLATILAQSCDTAYAKLGLKLGATKLYDEATSFGFNQTPPIDLPSVEVAPAYFPKPETFATNQPAIAYSSIGQLNVTETALENALVASAIADGGKIMKPHLMAKIVNNNDQAIETYTPALWRRATTNTTANAVRSLMVGVTSPTLGGTAAGVFPADITVAAKTGTAETGGNNCSADWMIATGPAGPRQRPTVAVAAVLPYQPGLPCSDTGAQAAGPLVSQVLVAAVSKTK